jgi:polyferredoxin
MVTICEKINVPFTSADDWGFFTRNIRGMSSIQSWEKKMSFRAIVSFAAGGAFLMLVMYEIIANAPTVVTYYNPYPLILQTLILGFISFLLIGFGLQLMINELKKPASSPGKSEEKPQ